MVSILPQPTTATKATPQGMFRQGYRAELRGSALLIVRPDGHAYRVDLAAGTCSCPASMICKHIVHARALCVATADSLCDEMAESDLLADAERTERGYTAAGLGFRQAAVELSERAWRLRVYGEGRR